MLAKYESANLMPKVNQQANEQSALVGIGFLVIDQWKIFDQDIAHKKHVHIS